ncbi:cell surface protein SprA, partial [candidate division GN15 bacterium]|nr:cell surface protein SprA [candidate division GN15 bacterium]
PDDSLYYEFLNGTEGNRRDATTQGLPDQEKLTGAFSETNEYFSFFLDLDNRPDSFRVEGSERNGWVTYRIPIRDSLAIDTIVGNPQWDQINHIRVWFESDEMDDREDTLEIADWYFVQSNWQDTLVLRPGFTENVNFVVASVSTDDGTFDPPPNVEAYRDPTQNVEEAQRGLSLRYENLRPGDTAIASRELIQSEAYSGYRTLEMFVWGDSLTNVTDDSVTFFLRLGTDSANFYEYHTVNPLVSRWSEQNHVLIDFNEITVLKDEALRNLESGDRVDITRDQYRVKGTPNINQIKYFAFGVTNVATDSMRAVTGEVWCDELRVTSVRRDVGTAARVSVAGNMADLINYSFSYQSKDPYFRGISAATRGGSSNNLGSGQTEKNLAWNASINIDKFLPRSWSARVPISLSYNRTTQLPLLRNNSDIVLPEELREEEKSTSESRSFRISEQFNKKSKNPLFSVLLNRQSASFSYQRSRQTSVNRPYYLGENYTVQGSYDMGIREAPELPIFFWTKWIPLLKKTSGSKLLLFPSSWRWSGSLNRSLSISEDSDRRRVSSLRKDFSGSMDLSYKILPNLRTSLRYSTKRDLTNPDLVNITLSPEKFKLGLETNYSQSFSADYDPKLFNFLTGKWTYSASYRDTWERSNETRKSDLSRNWGVSGQFKHLELFSIGSTGGGRRGGGNINRPFFDPPLALLRFLTGWIDPFSYKYGQTYNSSLPGMLKRPSLAYRFGINEVTDVETITEARKPFSSEGESYDIGSGFELFGGIDTDIGFAVNTTRDLVRSGTRYENRSIKWPDLRIRISQFKSFPLIKGVINKFISVFQPRTGFSRDVKETYDLDNDFLTDRAVTVNYNPVLSITFRVFRSLQLSGSYTLTRSEAERYNRQNGELDNETRSSKSAIAFSTRYSFSAPGGIGIPLFGNVKFQSQVSIDLNVRYSSNLTENSQDGRPFVVTNDRSELSIAPVISYTFSQQIKGGISARWQDNNDSKLNRKSHTRELQIWAEIRF